MGLQFCGALTIKCEQREGASVQNWKWWRLSFNGINYVDVSSRELICLEQVCQSERKMTCEGRVSLRARINFWVLVGGKEVWEGCRDDFMCGYYDE